MIFKTTPIAGASALIAGGSGSTANARGRSCRCGASRSRGAVRIADGSGAENGPRQVFDSERVHYMSTNSLKPSGQKSVMQRLHALEIKIRSRLPGYVN